MSDAPRARMARAQQATARHGADFLLIAPSADFRWLTGARVRATERLLALALPARGEAFCLVPRLEAGALGDECPWLRRVVWEDHEDAFGRLAAELDLARPRTLLLGEGFRLDPILRLAAGATCRSAAPVLEPLRAVKDQTELLRLAEAGRHADQVVMETAEFMRAGMAELEVGRFAQQRFEALGDGEPWAIVASGPNSALPHHFSSARRLQEGDVVVLDVGAFTEGYGSDITRTFWLGAPPPEAETVYGVVDEARRAGIAAVRAGAAAESVDRAARAVIERAGYGPRFEHRIGHGVGLEVHEPPYIVGGNRAPLEAGMVHSVEPGIYLEGRFGVRLEDLVVVEAGGARRLNQAPLEPARERVRR
jgi:Xaa-Pro aminopeptidase